MERVMDIQKVMEQADKEGLLPSDIIEREGYTFTDEQLEEAYELKMNPKGGFNG